MRILVLIFVSLIVSSAAVAQEHQHPPVQHSKEFERLKTLVGEWKGTTTEGEKKTEVTVEYKLTAGGSALVETLFPGTAHEMISIYHDRSGALSMTHYCMLGNQPQLEMTKSTPSEIVLSFGKSNTIDPKLDEHMHSLRIELLDKDTIVQYWTHFKSGVERDPTVFRLTRVQ